MKKEDFYVKGTQLPKIKKGTRYRCKFWDVGEFSNMPFDLVADLVSYGKSDSIEGDYILAERLNYTGAGHYEFHVNDIMKLYNEQNPNNMNKTIIGYKCPTSIFNGQVKKDTIYKKFSDLTYSPFETPTMYNLPKEIVESWKPVYAEPEFTPGTVVYVEHAVSGCTGMQGRYGVIVPKDTKAEHGLMESDKHDYKIKDINTDAVWRVNGTVRKLTEDEIKNFTERTVIMSSDDGAFLLYITKDGIMYKPDNAFLHRRDIERLVGLTDYTLGYTKNSQVRSYNVAVVKVDVGCKKGTLISQWKNVLEIYKAINNYARQSNS